MTTSRTALIGVALAALCGTPSTATDLEIQSPHYVFLRSGSGTIALRLTNLTNRPVLQALALGTPIDSASSATLPTVKVAFFLEPSAKEIPKMIPPHASFDVIGKFTGMTGTAAAQVGIFNGTAHLRDVEIIALDPALNVSVDTARIASTPLILTRNEPLRIPLKNDDSEPYSIKWTFRIGGDTESGTVMLPASGESKIVVNPSWKSYSWTDIFKPSVRIGELAFSLDVPGLDSTRLLTARSLPVSLTLRPFGPALSALITDGYVAIFLALGGVLSLLGSSVLPSVLRRIALTTQLRDLADRTTGVSTRVDSYLRVLLRLERKKIDVLLRSIRYYRLDVIDRLDEAATYVGRLGTRLSIAERLDGLRRKLESASATLPSSIITEVDAKLQVAADQLHAFTLSAENVKAAGKSLDDAGASLAKATDIGILAQEIATNFKSLKTRVANFLLDHRDLKAALSGIFAILEGNFDDPRNISAQMAYAIDHGIAAIHIALDYAVVRSSIPHPPSANCQNLDTTATGAATKHECELLALLGTMSWQALRDARTLVREMREGIYEGDVLKELEIAGQAEVAFDTQRARPYLPVFFFIRFEDPRFLEAAAIDRLSCHWEFPSDLREEGWKICHFFQGNESIDGKAAIRVSIRNRASNSAKPVTLSGTIEIQPTSPSRGHSRLIAETLRFLIAFGVALAGLLSGAIGQLQKLDMVPATFAIIGIGFSADALKNLITRNSKAVP